MVCICEGIGRSLKTHPEIRRRIVENTPGSWAKIPPEHYWSEEDHRWRGPEYWSGWRRLWPNFNTPPWRDMSADERRIIIDEIRSGTHS